MAWILIALGAACALYGISVMLVWSGSAFFLVWYALAAVIGGSGILALAFPEAGPARMLACAVLALTVLGIAGAGALSARIMSETWREPPRDLDYLVVLGAQVRQDGTPSEVLRHRLTAAETYLDANPRTRAVVTGGQGPNEPCPEGDAMAAWLEARGIAAERIVVEDAAETTVENLENSWALIADPDATVGIVTNDFHLFRAVRMARHQGISHVMGIPAYSTPWYLPNNLLRECLAVVKARLTGTI